MSFQMTNRIYAYRMAGSFSSQTVTCPYHPEETLIEDHVAGDLICGQCGLVVGDRVIDVSLEWQTFSNKKSTSAISLVGDAQLSGSHRSLMNPSTEMADSRNVSKKIWDKAIKLFNQVQKSKRFRGRRKDAIASACLYIARAEKDDPGTIEEIVRISEMANITIHHVHGLVYAKAVELLLNDSEYK